MLLLRVALALLATVSESFRSASFVGSSLALRCGELHGRRSALALAAARGDADAYRWRQRSDRLEIVVPVPPATRAADLDVAVTSSHLRVEIAPSDGGEAAAPLVDGALSAPVIARDSRAALTGVGDARALAIGLIKDSPGRWPRLLVGEVPRVAEEDEGEEGAAPTASRELAEMTAREMWDELAARGISVSKAASASALAAALADARDADVADGENGADDETPSEDSDPAVAEALETLSPQLAAMLGVEPPKPPSGADEPISDDAGVPRARQATDPADAAAAAVAEMKQTRRPPPDPSDFDAFYEWVME